MEITKDKRDISHSISDSFEDCLARLDRCLQLNGIYQKAYTSNSLELFRSLSQDRQEVIEGQIKSYCNILEKSAHTKKRKNDTTRDEEIDCILHAMKEFNLTTRGVDDDFSFVELGDIVEIYNFSNIQIYRNFELLKRSPHDFLTLLSTEWFKLYERSEAINRKIMQQVRFAYTSEITEAIPFEVEEHLMRLKDVEVNDSYIVQFKYIRNLFDINTQEKVAFIVTQKNNPLLASGSDSKKFIFLSENHNGRRRPN